MRGGLGGFEAAALVDRDVDQHCAALHRLEHVARDELGRCRTRHQHRADDQVAFRHRAFDRRLGGILRLDGRPEVQVELGQAIRVDVVDGDVGAKAGRHHRGVDARDAAAEDRDLARVHAGHAAQEDPASALFLFEVMLADMNRHAAGDFAHRLEERKRAGGAGHGFIGDAGRARFHQALGLRLVGGEVEIGVERVVRLQHGDFARLRLFHLHDHLGRVEHFGRAIEDGRTDAAIMVVAEIDAHAGIGLDEHLVAVIDQFGDRAGGQADAIFVILDFLGHTDAHGTSSPMIV